MVTTVILPYFGGNLFRLPFDIRNLRLYLKFFGNYVTNRAQSHISNPRRNQYDPLKYGDRGTRTLTVLLLTGLKPDASSNFAIPP